MMRCHPATPCVAVRSLCASVTLLPDGSLRLTYTLVGDLARLRIPAPLPPAATDGLWQYTCFEAFIAVAGEAPYREFNFSSSGQWAAYGFSDYRVRSGWVASQAPSIRFERTPDTLVLVAVIAAADLPPSNVDNPRLLGLTAVIEVVGGSKSYWALRHPAGPPDFHHRDGFAFTL